MGFIWLQKSVNLGDTMEGKITFENFCQEHGIAVQHYHADNGIFTSNTWRQSCLQQGQGLTFAGVTAHHQNGIAERQIRDLQEMACMMLILAHHTWPSTITPNLWPYALRMTNNAINIMPNLKFKDARMPIESFMGTKVASNPKHWHLFRRPTYVLVQDLQTDTTIHHKWISCLQVGVYLGQSPQHAQDVSLVLNLEMGLVSPQFHVKLNSNFQTLREKGARLPMSTWQVKCSFVQQPTRTAQRDLVPEARPAGRALPMQQPEGVQQTAPADPKLEPAPEAEAKDNQDVDPEPQELPPLQRFRCLHCPVNQLMYAMTTELAHASPGCKGELFCLEALFLDALVYAASKDPDTMYMHQVMKEPDKDKFIAAMVKEMDAKLKGGNFSLNLRSNDPKGATIHLAVWQMKRKC